jgi:hypothetical protein
MDAHETALKRASLAPTIAVGALLVVAGVMIGVRIREDRLPRETPSHPGPADVPQSAGSSVSAAGTGLPDPATVAMLLDDVSADPPVRTVLHEPDWLRRAIRATGDVAAGRVPRDLFHYAAPTEPFSVEGVGRDTVISTASYRRYDAFADGVGGISPAAVRALFVALRAPIDEASDLLGEPPAAFDTVVKGALLRVEAAPVVDGDVLVRKQGGSFVFEEARLEALGNFEKQLLRMGPRNTRVLQSKAKEIREALGIEEPPRTALAR